MHGNKRSLINSCQFFLPKSYERHIVIGIRSSPIPIRTSANSFSLSKSRSRGNSASVKNCEYRILEKPIQVRRFIPVMQQTRTNYTVYSIAFKHLKKNEIELNTKKI